MTLVDALEKYFGYHSFRPHQQEVIEWILQGKDCIGQFPTSYGKSLLYQLPALLSEGITIVISPLIALMKDQVQSLKKKNIEAVYFSSKDDFFKRKEIFRKLQSSQVKILYLSPEQLRFCRNHWPKNLKVSLFAVDEAHTILWGETFRTDFLKISEFIEQLANRPPILALTATATGQTIEKIKMYLCLKNPKIISIYEPKKNFIQKVEITPFKERFLISYLKHTSERGLVYCLSKKRVEELYELCISLNFSCLKFHGGMEIEEKEKNYRLFENRQANFMICTNAFGMGIDLPDLRFVLLYEIPLSIEDYVQEIGRACRDQKGGESILLFDFSDLKIMNFFCKDRISRQKTEDVVDFCLTKKCRNQWLASYFGHIVHSQCFCDNCQKKALFSAFRK